MVRLCFAAHATARLQNYDATPDIIKVAEAAVAFAAEVVVGGNSYADARLNCKLTIAHRNRLSLYLDLPQSVLPFCGVL
jgi:hypothetical protein